MLGETNAGAADGRSTARSSALFGIVLVIATAGLIYELAIAAVASYLLGDTVGVYLSALGLGAYLSRYIDRDLTTTFVRVEFATALIGGLSVIGLELSFSFGAPFTSLTTAGSSCCGSLGRLGIAVAHANPGAAHDVPRSGGTRPRL